MLAPWTVGEVKTAKLNDKCLNERLAEVLSQLAARPTASIPAACGGRAEMVAAYRFCENQKTSFEAVLQPHRDATRQRMAAQPVVIRVQDTTEIDTTRPAQEVVGEGALDGNSRRGALLHILHAFTADDTPRGTVHATACVREEEPVCAPLSRAERAARPLEEKESHRWVVALQHARAEAPHCPATQFVCVADGEADIDEVLAAGTRREPGHGDWFVRACQNRVLLGTDAKNAAGKYVREGVLGQPVLSEKSDPRAWAKGKSCLRHPWTTPTASVSINRSCRAGGPRSAAFTLATRSPTAAVTVSAVSVGEVNPPPDDEPVGWLLRTSLRSTL